MFKSLTPSEIDSEYGINDPWDYVTSFENVLKDFCGYKHAIACDSNTNAIKLCLEYLKIKDQRILIPANTYVSVPNQIINSGNHVDFEFIEWEGEYELGDTKIIDSACKLEKGDFTNSDHYKVLSFHHRKIIPIGRGGMILTNDSRFEKWARPMIYDGRDKTKLYSDDTFTCHGWHMYMTPEEAKRGLELIHQGVVKSEITIKETNHSYKDLRLESIFLNSNEIEVLKEWNYDKYYRTIKNIVSESQGKTFILILPQEFILNRLISYFTQIDDVLKQNNNTLLYFCGSKVDKSINDKFKRLKIVYWDSIDFFIKNYSNKHWHEFICDYNECTHHFSIMVFVKRGREWRCQIIEDLYRNNVIESTMDCVRVDDYTSTNAHLHIDGETILWDYTKDKPYDEDLSDNFDPQFISTSYKKGFIDIVVETLPIDFFITEKTLRPLVSKKPFLVFSGVNFHKQLRDDYGIKLYDSVFDYSFDDVEDDNQRFKMLSQELKRVKETYSIDELKEKLGEDAEYNYNKMASIRRTKIPHDVPYFFHKKLFDLTKVIMTVK